MNPFEAWWDEVKRDHLLTCKMIAQRAWAAALEHHAEEREAVRELLKRCVEAAPDGFLLCLVCGTETDTGALKHAKRCGVPRVQALIGKRKGG